ncbi:MAG: DUF5009 domain-containing protein [Chitinophagales bacterium]|nr:DUF5009 domain-containing protein [Chitinophagales bacterium]
MEPSQKNRRLQSLDALRGFDMLWIIGFEGMVHGMSQATGWPVMNWLSAELHHSPWNGFTIYDLIFPLFIFVSGVSMPFSFGKKLEGAVINVKTVKNGIYRSLIKRTIILILLGMIVNKSQHILVYDQMRFASVLGRIALSCFFAALIYLNSGFRWQIFWFLIILFGYWALMEWVPVPGFGAGVLTPEGNLASYLDREYLPGKVLREVYDPEGLLSTIPAIGTALLGVFTGRFLRYSSPGLNHLKKSFIMIGSGFFFLGIGLLWNNVFPINKNMWTSSFVIYTGGWSLLLLGLFYLIIDTWGLKKWSVFLVWIGTNSILIYLLSHGVFDFQYTSDFLFSGLINFSPERWHFFWLNSGILLMQLMFLRYLYKKKLFWKI